MPVIRLLLLLLVLGGLTLLLVQNWSPVLPLVFLGMATGSLPLAVWILLSIAAGAFTSLLITGLFKLSNYFVQNSSQRSKAPPERTQRSGAPKTASPSQPDTDSTPNDTDDDWDTDSTLDDWDFEDDTNKTPNTSQNTVRDSKTYEVSNGTKTVSQSSAYSYNYRERGNSGVGKTESVYDADYRVITPPYQQTNTAQENDDWGLEDDDFDDEGDNSPRVRR